MLFRCKEFSNKDFQEMKIILYQIKNYFKFVNLQYTLSLKDLYNSFDYEQDLYIKVSENLKNKKKHFIIIKKLKNGN